MGNKMKILGAAVALAVSGAAQATDAILFDTNGAAAGGEITVGSFDWTPDNALAVGAVPLPTAPTTNTFTLYMQASLGNFIAPDGKTTILGTGLGTDFEITFQSGFTEAGTHSIIPGFGDTSLFSLPADTPVNFFTVFYDTSMNANQLTGTGYGDGTIILQGVVINNSTSFLIPFTTDTNGDGIKDAPDIVLLDNFGADNANGTLTLKGSGGGDLQADVTSQNSLYFLSNITSLLVDLEFNTSNITPFSQANPSDAVVGHTPVYGVGVDGVSLTNGAPCADPEGTCDFQFQADGTTSFNSVPEPGSLLLLGAGLMGMGWSARRRKA